jgi:hypothetical protein
LERLSIATSVVHIERRNEILFRLGPGNSIGRRFLGLGDIGQSGRRTVSCKQEKATKKGLQNPMMKFHALTFTLQFSIR